VEIRLGPRPITAHRRAASGLVVLPLCGLAVAGILVIGAVFTPIAAIVGPALCVLVAALLRPRPLELRGELSFDALGLHVDDIPLIGRGQMTDGSVERRVDGTWRVSITGNGRLQRVSFTVKDRRRARAILSALHIGPDHTIRSFKLSWHRLRSPWVAVAVALLPLLIGVSVVPLFGVSGIVSVVVTLTLYAALHRVLLVLTPELAIGPDGILLKRARRSGFIAFERIRSVAHWPQPDGSRSEGLDLTLTSGEIVPLRTANVRESGQVVPRDPVYARLRTLLRRRRDEGAVAARLLPRRRQPMLDWVLRLRRLGAGADVGPRVAAVSSDDLLRLLESPAVDPTDRAAAAVALGSSDRAPEVRARIERISSAVLSPRLRLALEKVAEHPDDDDRLAEALTPLCRQGGAP